MEIEPKNSYKVDVEKHAPGETLETDFSKAEIYDSTPRFVEEAGTKRNIKCRHAQIIAIGSAIGTNFLRNRSGPFTWWPWLPTSRLLSHGHPGIRRHRSND